MTISEVLLPAEAAQRLGVPTRVILEAMYEKRLPRIKLDDGTLGVPADSLDTFVVPSLSDGSLT
jgi:hypothetical protein